MDENWAATELLPKLDVPLDLLTHIKLSVGEEMFNNFRLYYGDDPDRYNLSFEAIFGTYCNKIEWIAFLKTALATAAHAITFHDLNKMTTGKMLFYIQVPRVATGSGLPTSRQTTVMVSKYTEKNPITIPFEISAACLTHLQETFQDTLLDKLLNADAVNTVLRAVKNTANAMERGLIDTFLKTLLRHAPPCFVLRTLIEHGGVSKRMATRVQRSNIAQGFKSKMLNTIFLLDRSKDRNQLHRYIDMMSGCVTESILDNPETYTIGNGERLAGVLVSTQTVIQTLLTALSGSIRRVPVKTPASYGKFVLSKENAVTAIAHHAIMADFNAHADRIQQSSQKDLQESQFLDQKLTFTETQMDVLKLGERHIALEHLHKVYKNTDAANPLEREVELTFYFPIGLHVPPSRAYSTADNKIKLAPSAETQLPTTVYFYNKDKIPQKLSYSDSLRTLCHPAIHDATPCLQDFAEKGPPEDDERIQHLCKREFTRDSMAHATRRLVHFYQMRREPPRTANEVKHEFTSTEFGKVENYLLYTELHPFFDFCHVTVQGQIQPLCTPRILVGNIPEPLAPADFQEMRAKQVVELTKIKPPEGHEATLQVLRASLTDPQYPELFYILESMIHGDAQAFNTVRDLIARSINNYFRMRGNLAFANSYEMIHLIATQLGDGGLLPQVHAHYRNILSIIRYVIKTGQMCGLNGRLADESLLSYVNALFDTRLWPPFIQALPRAMNNVHIVADRDPLDAARVEVRNPGMSDVARLIATDQPEPLFVDARRTSDEDFVAHKIFYLCLLPAMTNNHACGAGLNLKHLLVKLFYTKRFLAPDELPRDPADELLLALVRDIATDDLTTPEEAADELFLLLAHVPEHAQMLEIRAALDPSQRHGAPSAGFESLQHVLYEGFCLINQPKLLHEYLTVIPFHRFYSDPTLAANVNRDIRIYLNDFPHYQRTDGGFPLSNIFSHEYQHWNRTPFSCYSNGCSNTLESIVTMACMHHKLSPVSIALMSKMGIHPGFALTAVRTDTFETDTMLYSTKASSAIIINTPVVTKEDRDINTVFHVTQNINTVDMSLGYGSASCVAHLRRARSDMGSRVQDLFQTFPMQVYRNEEVDTWIRQTTGARRNNMIDSDAMSVLTFGRQTDKGGPSLLHGQRATCELILTPVSANLEYFRHTNNPRGRSSSMLGVDPYDDEAALSALYDHKLPDAQTFYSTNNPWASQRGSLGDVLYNARNREKLGHNPSVYSPCSQFFTTDEIIASNKTLFKTVDEYLCRAQDCIHGDTDLQYIRVEGTDALVEKPCRFLQEAITQHCSTTQALLESQLKGNNTLGLDETHFGNYSIRETIPLQQSILFNS
ncbi:a86 [Rat cytomegalovirus ALL-03]|uniref:A86 n=2 Tax=Rat cytomegalovirus (isolate England) TaxID=1261657 RepID=A0A0F6R4B0_RCMVE|nr:E86 [Murid betaherpesvirus 8]AKE44253.1 a86 [Rat cytomegalovirus ALL-03]AFX83400.1 E86 [Murid betaherpesvirus 8]WEG71873.1 major capsid protein [Murid betaherpesvirus 8]WPH25263.1 major capsid protein [Murid betaherpesvirus 8]WPH25396.1 major capsid protein [Murid betaherpesvirus 8]